MSSSCCQGSSLFNSPAFLSCNSFARSFLSYRYTFSSSDVVVGTANHYFNTCKFTFNNMGDEEDVVKLGTCVSRFILYLQSRWRKGKMRGDGEGVDERGVRESSDFCIEIKNSPNYVYDKKLYQFHPVLLWSFNMLLSFISYIPSPSRLSITSSQIQHRRFLDMHMNTTKDYFSSLSDKPSESDSLVSEVQPGRDTPLHLILMGLSTIPSHLLLVVDSNLLKFHVMHSPPPSIFVYVFYGCRLVFCKYMHVFIFLY